MNKSGRNLVRNALAVLTLAFAGSAFAQEKLTIGSKAPDLKVEGWVKGSAVPELKKGNVYVIEFWATWCGPCIAVFPHLSDLAEKYKDKVTVVSINTWDYTDDPSADSHKERVAKFVKEKDNVMRYNIALDDSKDTMANTWMKASYQRGIPCAFIVNENLEIAWIGHPANMDQPLEAIVNKTWDMAAYKEAFETKIKAAVEQDKKMAEIAAAAKAGDAKKFDELTKGINELNKISLAAEPNPSFALGLAENGIKNVEAKEAPVWCSLISYIVRYTDDINLVNRAMALSGKVLAKCNEENASVGSLYHADILRAAGKKEEAIKLLEKALTQADKYKPEEQRPMLKKAIQEKLDKFKS